MALAAVFALMASSVTLGKAATKSTPGLPPPTHRSSTPDPLLPFFSDSGLISLSVDAVGTKDPAGTPIRVHKNAGATVRKAFLFAASTGFSTYTPVPGDVTLDGAPVAWDPANTIDNGISSVNVVADVTSLVKAKIDAAPAGDVSFTAAEPNNPSLVDGEILAVILDDPTATQPGSITILYGAQNPAGDTFHVALAEPVDKTDPSFALNLSLGISYGFQPADQFSTVDVNGIRMTSSAGGQDDSVDVEDGTLITAGGIGDSNDNPPDPNATDTDCVGPEGPAPRCDDELYNLLPFVNNGDSSLTFTTTNPSNDDNIFFAALEVRAGAAVVGEGVVLAPTLAVNEVGKPHILTATVQSDNGNPIPGVTVHFEVTSGPNTGTAGNAVTGASGKADFTYTSSSAGADHIVASFTDSQGIKQTSNEAIKAWVSAECEQQVVNDKVAFAVSGTAFDPAPATDAPAGTFAITAVLSNISSGAIQIPISTVVTTLSSPATCGGDGNKLLSATEGDGGVGSRQAIDSAVGDALEPGEEVTATFLVGLCERKRFEFFVDVEGCVRPDELPAADLSITKTGSPDRVTVGGILTYTVEFTNHGPGTAFGVTVVDTLPAGVAFRSAPAGCAETAGAVTCNLGDLGSGTTGSVIIDATPTAAGVIVNTAHVTSRSPDPDERNNAATAITEVAPPPHLPTADLAIDKSDSPDPVTQGVDLTYTVTVTNLGEDTAFGATVIDLLPAGVTFRSACRRSSPPDPCISDGCAEAAGTVTCSLGDLSKDATGSVTIVGRPTAAGEITNTASVTSNVTDPKPGNNAVSESTTVNPGGPDLAAGFGCSRDGIQAMVTNVGEVEATGFGTQIIVQRFKAPFEEVGRSVFDTPMLAPDESDADPSLVDAGPCFAEDVPMEERGCLVFVTADFRKGPPGQLGEVKERNETNNYTHPDPFTPRFPDCGP